MCSKKYISSEKFDINDLVFGELSEGELRDGTNFKKTPISVKRLDESVGPLIMVSETCFSFGVQKDSKYESFTIPLMLCDRDEPTREQKLFVKAIRDIISACNPKSCFYGNEDNPILYLKIDFDMRCGEFTTKCYERKTMEDKKSTKEIKPEKYIGKYCLAKVAMRIDSIFVVNSATLQIKAHTVILSEAKRRKPTDVVDVLDEM